MTIPRPYPDHIYDQKRILLAQSIIEKELRKLFLKVSNDSWKAIDKSTHDWYSSPGKYHLENNQAQDFWDIFAAIMESIKLKPNFTSFITASNVEWHKANLHLKSIQMTSPLDQLKKVPDLNLRNDLTFAELIDALSDNEEITIAQRKIVDEHSTDPEQDNYPIVTKKTADGLYKVMDGNRRALKSVLYGKDTIEAWVATTDDQPLTNYWIPINDMFQLVIVYKRAVEMNDIPLQNAVALVLKSYFEVSIVAKQAYENRIGNQNDTTKSLYELVVKM